MVNTRRTRIEIIFDILDYIQMKKGNAQLTKVMYKCNLSHMLLKKYINVLKEKELITITTHKKKIKMYHEIIITVKGINFLEQMKNIVSTQNQLLEQLYGTKDKM